METCLDISTKTKDGDSGFLLSLPEGRGKAIFSAKAENEEQI